MGFGYNRYALVLAVLAATTAGCSESGGGSNRASTGAPITSNNNNNPGGPGPELTKAEFIDVDQNNMLSKGDRVVLSFDAEIEPLQAAVDPHAELRLAVAGDSFGLGATMQNGATSAQLDVVLGDRPILRVSDPFDLAFTQPGAASGLNVSLTASVKGAREGVIRPAPAPVDVAGALQSGFMPAGNLTIARGGHSSILLDDGRVLIVGGVAGGTSAKNFVAEAELYDPTTQSFTLVSDLSGELGRMKRGSIAVRFIDSTAVKLQDGTVLICGGFGVEKKGLFGLGSEKVDTLESAFLFNPADNTFTRVGDMQYPRHSHTATVMDDGRVMIAGGYNDSWWSKHKTQSPVEIYDPAKKAFEKIGGIFSRLKTKEGRMNHTATAIEGGTGILLAGGNRYEGGWLFGLIKPKLKMSGGSEVIRNKKSEGQGALNVARMSHAAELVTPRQVLIAGGHDPNQIHSSLELFDSATGQWSPVGDLKQARTGCEVVLDRTDALVIGGTNGSNELDTVEVWSADSKTLSQTAYKLSAARNAFTATKLKDGRILVIGGTVGAATSLKGFDGQALASAEVFVRQ